MEKFTHGIMVIDHSQVHDDGHLSVVHFVGFWDEPGETDFTAVKNEVKTNPEYGLVEVAEHLELRPASQDAIDFFNQSIDDHEEDN